MAESVISSSLSSVSDDLIELSILIYLDVTPLLSASTTESIEEDITGLNLARLSRYKRLRLLKRLRSS